MISLTTLQLPCLPNQHLLCLIRSKPTDPQGLFQTLINKGISEAVPNWGLSYDSPVVHSAEEQKVLLAGFAVAEIGIIQHDDIDSPSYT